MDIPIISHPPGYVELIRKLFSCIIFVFYCKNLSMALSMNDIHVGMVIGLEGQLYRVMTRQHKKMQQSRPVVRAKLKNIKTGAVVE